MTADVSGFHVCPVLGLWQVSKEEHYFSYINFSNETFLLLCAAIY